MDLRGPVRVRPCPKGWAPGTKMAFAGIKEPEDRADVLVYLRTLADSPCRCRRRRPSGRGAPAGADRGGGRASRSAAEAPAGQALLPVSRRPRPRGGAEAAAAAEQAARRAGQQTGGREQAPPAGARRRRGAPAQGVVALGSPTPTRPPAPRTPENAPPATASRRAAPPRSARRCGAWSAATSLRARLLLFRCAGRQGRRLGLPDARRISERAEGLGARHQDGFRRDQEARGARRRDPLPALALERPRAVAVNGPGARSAAHDRGGAPRWELVEFALRLADAAGAVVAQVLSGAAHRREQVRRQPGDGRRSRGRAGAARADPRDLSGSRHRRRGVPGRAPGRRVRLAPRSDRRHQVVRGRPPAVRHADRADPGRPPHPRRDRPVHPGRALARRRRSGQHLERPADPRALLPRARARGAVGDLAADVQRGGTRRASPASRAPCGFRSMAATATPTACWRWA